MIPVHEAGHVLEYIKIISDDNNSNNRRHSNNLLSVYYGNTGGATIYRGRFKDKIDEIKILASGIAATRLYEGAKPIGIISVLIEKWFFGGYSDIKSLQNLGLSLKEIVAYINICMASFSDYDKEFMEIIINIMSSQPKTKNKYAGFICHNIPKKNFI